MIHSDQDILSVPYEVRERQSLVTLQSFYKYAKPIADKSIKQAAEMGPNFKTIKQYFRPIVPQALKDIILCLFGSRARPNSGVT